MKNSIQYITKEKANQLIDQPQKGKRNHIGIIDGIEIKTIEDYFACISKLYRFPESEVDLDLYNDLMRNLAWFDYTSYSLFILNYDTFMCDDLQNKIAVMDSFLNVILPWWDMKAEYENKVRHFDVYLVN